MAPQLSWIGLGNMGRGMVKNLVEKGNLEKPLLLYNRTKKRAEELAATLPAGKAEAVDSIEEAVKKADIIFVMVSNDTAAQDVFDTILEGDVAGKLFVECSTLHPDTTEKIAKSATDKGAEFVASPVFGAPAAAVAGQLIFVPAGPKSAIDKLRPYIQGVMGRAEIAFEDAAYGQALKLKLLGNSLILNMVTSLAEGHAAADKTGVGPAPFRQLVDLLFGGIYGLYSERMVAGTYWKMAEPLFSANNARKDAAHMADVARAAGAELRFVAVADEYLRDVADHAGGDKGDIAGIYGAARKRAGLKFENDA
ncbi:6-phosphogluconate dehydrogenase 2 [Durotheca rogersii]|uniref:6-phosphogluconate dehydrogenase 2 n=1 Tax=Durotheca rogersii TaxID=419775 RepID=UPI00221F752D|nr:6-phosphogluconate dehydrogenase 2 [Durotheca rogersii]KAI5868604.1 6-phosphogluconate dehydrogenase 2 [Durotheca rogersii]